MEFDMMSWYDMNIHRL